MSASAMQGGHKKPTRYHVFSRMCRVATAESILIKFRTSTPWADTVIYLKRHPNWSKGSGGVALLRTHVKQLSVTLYYIQLPSLIGLVSHAVTVVSSDIAISTATSASAGVAATAAAAEEKAEAVPSPPPASTLMCQCVSRFKIPFRDLDWVGPYGLVFINAESESLPISCVWLLPSPPRFHFKTCENINRLTWHKSTNVADTVGCTDIIYTEHSFLSYTFCRWQYTAATSSSLGK